MEAIGEPIFGAVKEYGDRWKFRTFPHAIGVFRDGFLIEANTRLAVCVESYGG
jgi:hypothetical protein